MTTCEEFCSQLCDYVDGEVGRKECLLIEAHLDVCPPCALMYQSIRTTLDMCARGVSDHVPEDVQQRLKAFLREHCSGRQSQSQRGDTQNG